MDAGRRTPNDTLLAELREFTDLFGLADGTTYYLEGLTVSEAKEREITRLQQDNAMLNRRLKAAGVAVDSPDDDIPTGKDSYHAEQQKDGA